MVLGMMTQPDFVVVRGGCQSDGVGGGVLRAEVGERDGGRAAGMV
jgi:hypothetical protein